mgnify:CR=1 FL=1
MNTVKGHPRFQIVAADNKWKLQSAAASTYYMSYKTGSNKGDMSYTTTGNAWTITYASSKWKFVDSESRFLGYVSATEYAYKTYANSNYEGGSFPNNISILKLEAVSSCAAPIATSNGATTKTSQVVSWTDATGSAWDIYCSTSSTTPTSQTTATNLSNKTYTFNNLTPGTTYYWWVRTNCGSGSTSSWVAGTAFTTSSTFWLPVPWLTFLIVYSAGFASPK